MRVFTTGQIREFDRVTIDRYGVPSHSLMETAGHKLFDEIYNRYPALKKVFILLGRGNNGGDGLVVARLFLLKKIQTTILLTEEVENCSIDFKKNYEILSKVQEDFPHLETIKYYDSESGQISRAAAESDIIIDALLGTGMKSELKSPYRELIQFINSLNLSSKIIAVDIPSGLNGDTGSPMPDAIRASLTLTIGGGKAGLYSYPAPAFTGEIGIIDIGLPLANAPGPVAEITDKTMFSGMLRRDDINFHKGSGGHTGIIAGSADRPGAAYLSALGALKAGAGLVTLISERKVTEGVVRLYPEIMTREADYNNDSETYFSKLLSGIDSLVIGPGLSEENTVLRWVKSILTDWNGYLVLDAEAFRITGDMRFDAAKTVITPHPVELARLMNIPKDEIQRDRIGHSIRCAQKLNTIVLLKGARSIIAKPSGDFTINMSGNRFMASGGMGDLLSGMTGALMYQTKSAYEAARIAAYLHGLASDIAIENGKFPLNATLVADYIKEAMINSGIYV